MNRTFWIVGAVLLIGMFVGVKFFVFDGSGTRARAGEDSTDPPKYVVAWGTFDVEKGVALMYPRQVGQVKSIRAEHKEGDAPVKKGTVLLQLDDAIMKQKLIQAQELLAEAKKLPKLYKLQKDQQQALINSIDSERKKTVVDRDRALKSVTDDPGRTKSITESYQFALDQLDQKKISEEARMKQLELQDADSKVKQAEASLEEAKETLEHFKIVAPSDGYMLRAHVHEGETLGPTPRIHALEFLPDAPIIVRAEVLQEWGRYVKTGLDVVIEDDTYKGPEWKGTVKSLSKWYAPVRNPVIEPFRYNDVRTLECIIEVKSADSKLLIGQRVRAKIKIEK